MVDLATVSWSQTELNSGMVLLAQKAGLRPVSAENPPPSPAEAIDDWLTRSAERLQIDVQSVNWQYREYASLLRLAAPAILQITVADETRFLLLQRRGRRKVTILTPAGTLQRHSVQELAQQLKRLLAGELGVGVEQLLATTALPIEKRTAARDALLEEQLDGQEMHGCWLLQLAPYVPLRYQLRHSRISHLLAILFGLTALQQLITLVSWYFVGLGALQNEFAGGVIGLWVVVLLTGIPVQLFGLWVQATLSLNTGQLFRNRLLTGILNLRPATVRHLGSGQFLERIIKTESFQMLLFSGGLTAALAVVQLFSAVVVLALGIGGLPHALLLLLWSGLTLLAVYRYTKLHDVWSDTYRALTNDLVERMVGQRTRLAQQPRSEWHEAEDKQLATYQTMTRRLDRWQTVLSALIGRGWLIIGLAGIALPFLAQTPDITALAITVGGIILASQALQAVTTGVLSLANARRSWRDLEPLLSAAQERQPVGNRIVQSSDGAVLVARDLAFRFRPNSPPLLNNIDLMINRGDHVLLTGASGSGKSTLATLLTGRREPESGLLILHGLDRQMVGGAAWRARVVAAPQFHENHILTETLAFNLLMGRRWPPTEGDLREAIEICYELGLGGLLERMPSGLEQMVGEGGWQLSHGERSRIFIGRTLLQNADLVILDESFAALDPINLRLVMACVLHRAPTLLVIAHP